MTRFILVSACGALLALSNSTLGEPQPTATPDPKNKRFKRHWDHMIIEKSVYPSTAPTPAPNPQHISRSAVGEVGKAPTTSSRPSSGQNVPAMATPTPASAPNPQHIRGLVGEVGTAPTTTSRIGSGQNIPPTRELHIYPPTRETHVYVPNEYYEPDSPSAGPGFKTNGTSPGSFKTRTPSSVATSTPARKVVATKVLIPPLRKNSNAGANEEAYTAADIDANPPAPGELGAPIVIPMIPRYDAVPRSKALYLPDGNAPIPVDYTPPTPDGPVQVSPTSLRAWNGEMTRETRTFDQTRVQVTTGADDAKRWQFFWRTGGGKPRAARWEISMVPFVDDGNAFPPAGLVAYGDASVAAPSPAMENFFAVEFSSLAKHFGDEPMPSRFYLRVVPVDGSGHPAAQPSNWVRIDLR
ncbi:MAG: hypothetical protein M3128_07735 [Verrucomicrobiota bacterium]|nr:hypothetical protein [Verrucomicrobiota bacterium]